MRAGNRQIAPSSNIAVPPQLDIWVANASRSVSIFEIMKIFGVRALLVSSTGFGSARAFGYLADRYHGEAFAEPKKILSPH